MSEDAYDPEAPGEGPEPSQDEQDATRYPDHERPDTLRERAGLEQDGGREPELAPDVDGPRDGDD